MADRVHIDPELSLESLFVELDEVMARPDLNTGDERASVVVRDLAFWARRMAVVARLTQDRARRAEAFLTSRGYRRCDAATCNCKSWHREPR